MPALPSRPSTTIARRCAASCTDRTLHRFCQAFTPSAQQIEGSHSRPLPRCSALRLQLSPGGCLVCYRRILSVPARSGGGRLTLMSGVNGRGSGQRWPTDGGWAVFDCSCAAQGRRWSAETTVDQALIRGLGTAFRVFVSGLVLCLEGGRRAQPGHVVRDRGSPPWLHPRRCAARLVLSTTASTADHPMDAIFRERRGGLKAFARQQRPLGGGLSRGGALEHAG